MRIGSKNRVFTSYCYGVVVLNLFIIVLCGFVYFVMCRVVYVWVLYSMDVWGLCNNVSVDMVGNNIPWLPWLRFFRAFPQL